VVRGSALMALEDKEPEQGEQSVLKLMAEVDRYIRSRRATRTSRF